MFDFLAEWRSLFIALHLFAMVLGLGGATYSDILLMEFLKDLKISKKEASVIRKMSQVVLMGIILAFVSGLALFLPEMERLLSSAKFLVKVIVFGILVLNGFFLHQIVLPKLVKFSFHKDHYLVKQTIHLRHAGFVMGAISVVSWYSVFLLGAFPVIPFSFSVLLGSYVFVLLVAIFASLLLERKISSDL